MQKLESVAILCMLILCLATCSTSQPVDLLGEVSVKRGIGAVLGDTDCELSLRLARETDLLIYLQLESSEEVQLASRVIEEEGYFGNRIWIGEGDLSAIHLADNLVDFLVAADGSTERVRESEVLRVLCPEGRALVGSRQIVKPIPEGADDWSHPYHGPDNNPQSDDQVARAPYLTQFLAEPYYAPLTQVAVASGGKVFKAFGNIAFHVREEALLNSLVAFNGYNGTMVWRRKLQPGVMIHRNTMIATPELLYVGDDKSCKRIDTATGSLIDEIVPPVDLVGGTFWKWMALQDGVLYALVGEQEQSDPVVRQRRQAHGWPWDPLSKGFNQDENPWGFGANLIAIDPESKDIIWSHRESEEIDSRALCMSGGRIYLFRHGGYLACLDAASGEEIWRRTPENSPQLFDAIGPYLDRQDWRTNWRTTAYLKSSEKALYFAGPSIDKLLAVSAEDGSVLWQHPYDNFQLVLRKEGLYAISGQIDENPSYKFDPLTGEILETIDTRRRACTRPNGAVDAIFFRATGGSVRLDLASTTPQWISPMRAQCQDGVTIANGLLYWWPNVCDCQNTLYGMTSLGPAGEFNFEQEATESERLVVGSGDMATLVSLEQSPEDWPTLRADNSGTATTRAVVAPESERLWWYSPERSFTPTPPVTAGGMTFFSGSDGIVRALDVRTGNLRWKAYTGGGVRFPPTVWEDRLFVGSGDGWMYVYEAVTGRLLWRFNAAPANRRIPVYGSLMSTWPVASGVLVEDGVAYFAAGIANYDGSHVYALDARTGRIVWQNNTSGHLESEARTGVSVQGHLLINDGKLFLAGGTSVSPAVYDLADGRCLNDPDILRETGSTAVRGQELYRIGDKVVAGGQPLYGDPDYPVYDTTVFNKLHHTSDDIRDVIWLNDQQIMCFGPISNKVLNKSVAGSPADLRSRLIGWGKLDIKGKPLWQHSADGSMAFARSKNAILFAGTGTNRAPSLEALNIKTGERLWRSSQPIQGPPVRWGMAVDRDGLVVVALKEGDVMCFGPTQ